MYIYYQRYEAREQVSTRSRQARPKRIIQRICQWRRERKRRRGYFADALGSLIGTAGPVDSLSFGC